MKSSNNFSSCGFSRLEMAVVIAVIAIVGIVLFSALNGAKNLSNGTNCVQKVKDVALSFRLWASDNNDLLPMQIPVHSGGTKEFVRRGEIAPHFRALSNELHLASNLVCPGDKQARAADGWTNLTDANLSYFLVPEADKAVPKLWLVGDSNLTTNGTPLQTGLIDVKPEVVLSWTAKRHWRVGNIALTDGSVEQIRDLQLQERVTNALRAFYAATNSTPFRLLIP